MKGGLWRKAALESRCDLREKDALGSLTIEKFDPARSGGAQRRCARVSVRVLGFALSTKAGRSSGVRLAFVQRRKLGHLPCRPLPAFSVRVTSRTG